MGGVLNDDNRSIYTAERTRNLAAPHAKRPLVLVCRVCVSHSTQAIPHIKRMSQLIYLAFIVVAMFAFFIGILNFLPVGSTLPDGVSQAVILIFGYMQLFNFFFPIDTLMTVFLLVLAFQGAIFAWRIIRWTLAFLGHWLGK